MAESLDAGTKIQVTMLGGILATLAAIAFTAGAHVGNEKIHGTDEIARQEYAADIGDIKDDLREIRGLLREMKP